jgi:pimeloyl-ACP methyl ester carboxylesterase
MQQETSVQTPAEMQTMIYTELPFLFADPHDPRIEEYKKRTSDMAYVPDVMRYFAARDYGGIEVEDQLGTVSSPILVTAGKSDRICPPAAAESIAAHAPHAKMILLEKSGHFAFVEQQDTFLDAVRTFLGAYMKVGAR